MKRYKFECGYSVNGAPVSLEITNEGIMLHTMHFFVHETWDRLGIEPLVIRPTGAIPCANMEVNITEETEGEQE